MKTAVSAAMIAIDLALLLAALPARSAELGRPGFTGAADIEQQLGRILPGELTFRDERGSSARLGDYLGAGPLALLPAYYSCSNLCPMQIRNLAQRMAQTSGAAADRAQILVVSIDPQDSPLSADRARHKALDDLLSPQRAERWHFLSGDSADITRLMKSLGFSYGYDQATGQYAHPAGFALITPQGKISRYFFGLSYTADDLRHAFDQAAARRIASPIERLLLVCFHYDLANGTHSALIVEALRAVAIVVVLGMLALISILLRRARRPRT